MTKLNFIFDVDGVTQDPKLKKLVTQESPEDHPGRPGSRNVLPDNFAFYMSHCPDEWKHLPPNHIVRKVRAKLDFEEALRSHGETIEEWRRGMEEAQKWLDSKTPEEIKAWRAQAARRDREMLERKRMEERVRRDSSENFKGLLGHEDDTFER